MFIMWCRQFSHRLVVAGGVCAVFGKHFSGFLFLGELFGSKFVLNFSCCCRVEALKSHRDRVPHHWIIEYFIA